MSTQNDVESQTRQFLWKIGELYAKTSPELSRFYYSKYQSLLKANKASKHNEKLCQYCGSRQDGLSARTRILRKARTKKHKSKDQKSTQRLCKKCVIAIKCSGCKRTTFSAGSERVVTPTHLKAMKKEEKEKLQEPQKSDIGPLTLPENYSSLSASAKRKWRRSIQMQKMKEKGVFFWKKSENVKQQKPEDTKTNLMAFLSTIEK